MCEITKTIFVNYSIFNKKSLLGSRYKYAFFPNNSGFAIIDLALPQLTCVI